MAVKTLYPLTTVATGRTCGDMQEVAPGSTVNSVWGWVVNTIAANLYSFGVVGTERASSSFGTTVLPSIWSEARGWRSPVPYDGTFAAGDWSIRLGWKATTKAAGQDGNFRVRIYASQDEAGTVGRRELTPGESIASGMVTNLTTGGVDLTATWSAPEIVLENEYVWFMIAWQTRGAATASGADINYRSGPGSVITTTDFSAPPATVPAGAVVGMAYRARSRAGGATEHRARVRRRAGGLVQSRARTLALAGGGAALGYAARARAGASATLSYRERQRVEDGLYAFWGIHTLAGGSVDSQHRNRSRSGATVDVRYSGLGLAELAGTVAVLGWRVRQPAGAAVEARARTLERAGRSFGTAYRVRDLAGVSVELDAAVRELVVPGPIDFRYAARGSAEAVAVPAWSDAALAGALAGAGWAVLATYIDPPGPPVEITLYHAPGQARLIADEDFGALVAELADVGLIPERAEVHIIREG